MPLALDLTNKLLELNPHHPRAIGNKVYYESELQKTVKMKRKGDDELDDTPVANDVSILVSIHSVSF